MKGWNARTKEILKPFSSPERKELSDRLARLGEKIGREWAKDNRVRRIDTSMLQVWGNEMLAAKKEGVQALLDKIDTIEKDIDGLFG